MADKFTAEMLSASERKQAQTWRKTASAIGQTIRVAQQKAADLAPKLMAFFDAIVAKHGSTAIGGFVGFCRIIDPTVPMSADDKDGVAGYRNHKTYYALNYMRTVEQRKAARVKKEEQGDQQGKRNPATDQLARVLATILHIKGMPADVIWSAVATEFRLTDRTLPRLKARVKATEPVIDLSEVVTVRKVEAAKVIHMVPQQPTPSAAAVRESLGRAAKAVGVRNERIKVRA